MLKPFRKNYPMTRFIAIVVVFTSILPFIGHTCLMAEAHAGPVLKQCCCADAHGEHAGVKMTPCDEEKEASHMEDMHGDCCAAQFQVSALDEATGVKKVSPEELAASAFPSLPIYSIITPSLQKTAGELQDTGPPLSPYRLHLLYAQFRN